MDRNVKAFLAVARTGNLTAAAAEIGLTQPALTKTIRRIEEEFATRLFERTARGMVLTPAGELLRQRMALVEIHYRQAREEIRQLSGGALDEFRIAAGTAYLAIAPELVKRLCAAFPDTRIYLNFEVLGNAMPRLIDEHLDLLLGAFHEMPDESVKIEPVMNVEIHVYAAADSPLAAQAQVTPRDLAGRKWVLYQHDLQTAERLRTFCHDNLLPPPQIALLVDSLLATLNLASGGDFLTTGSSLVRRLAANSGLRMLPMEAPIWRFVSGAWYRRSMRDHPILRRSVELVRDLVGAELPPHSHLL